MKIILSQLMKSSKQSLEGKWGLAIGTFVLYMFFSACIQGASKEIPAIAFLSLLFGGPISLGLSNFTLRISRNEEARFEHSLSGFYNFSNALITYVLMLLIIIGWTLLLIIPGIIAAIAYSMTFYILAGDPDLAPMDALKKSKEMMDGHKWTYFFLVLRFVGLAILCILTLGIAFLWLAPYIQVTNAKFYDTLKNGVQ